MGRRREGKGREGRKVREKRRREEEEGEETLKLAAVSLWIITVHMTHVDIGGRQILNRSILWSFGVCWDLNPGI